MISSFCLITSLFICWFQWWNPPTQFTWEKTNMKVCFTNYLPLLNSCCIFDFCVGRCNKIVAIFCIADEDLIKYGWPEDIWYEVVF